MVDNLVCALLHALAKLFEEERSAAWLDVREAADQVVLHLQDAEHHVLHVLFVVLLRVVSCGNTFCQQFATQIVDVFFQVFAFHKPIIYIRYNSKVKVTYFFRLHKGNAQNFQLFLEIPLMKSEILSLDWLIIREICVYLQTETSPVAEYAAGVGFVGEILQYNFFASRSWWVRGNLLTLRPKTINPLYAIPKEHPQKIPRPAACLITM